MRPPVARAGGSPKLYENFASIKPLFARLWDGNGLSGTPRGVAVSLGPMLGSGVSTECLGSFQALVAAVAPPDAVVGSTQKCFGPASIVLEPCIGDPPLSEPHRRLRCESKEFSSQMLD